MKKRLCALFSCLLSGIFILLMLTAVQPAYAISSKDSIANLDKIDQRSKAFVSISAMGASLVGDEITSADDVTATDKITPTNNITPTDSITSADTVTSTGDITSTDDNPSTDGIMPTDEITSTGSSTLTSNLTSTDEVTSTDAITTNDVAQTDSVTTTDNITPTSNITSTNGVTSTTPITPTDDTPSAPPSPSEVELVVSSPQTMTRRIGSIAIDKTFVLTDSLLVIYPLVDGAPEIEPAGYECLKANEERLNWAVSLLAEKYAFTSTQYLVTLAYDNDPTHKCSPATQADYTVSANYNKPLVSVVLIEPEPSPTPTPTPDNRPTPTDTPTPTPTPTPPTPTPTPTPTLTSTPTPDAVATTTKLAQIIDAMFTAHQTPPTLTHTPTDVEPPTPIDTPTPVLPLKQGITPEPTATDTPDARVIKAEIALAVQETLTALPTPNLDATSTAFAQAMRDTLAALVPTFTPVPPSTATPNLQATTDALRTAVIAAITAQPTATPTPTFTATPTPITDYLQLDDQESNGTSVLVDALITIQDRWLVIYQIDQTNNVQIVGRTYVPAGKYGNTKILFQRYVEQGSLLKAMLHEDTGQVKIFDFPIADQPVKHGGVVVSDTFVLGSPLIRVSAQSGANVIINRVVLTDSGWIVLYDKAEEKLVGKQYASVGLTSDLTVSVTGLPMGVQRELMAVVHSDYGEPHFFDFPGPDLPMENGSNTQTQASFNFTYRKQDPSPSPMPQQPQRASATPTPTIATPSLYSPPNQYAPPNLAPIDEDRVTFQWRWTGVLPENWGFEVRGWLPEDPHNGIHDARLAAGIKPDEFGIYSLNLAIPDRFKGKIWYWTVAVVQLEPYQRIGLEAPPNIIVVPPVSD